jgi:arylsulfatase A-like enzyme
MYTFLKENVLDTRVKQAAADYSAKKTHVQLRDRYDELILSVDDEFGSFIRTLQEQGSYDNSIIIVSSDHGEVFTPTFVGHGDGLSDPLIHIPLVIHLPGQKGKKMVLSPAEQVDIAPTILDYVGLSIPDWMEGESLRPFMETEIISQKPKFSMNLDKDSIHGPVRYGVVAIITEGHKLIHNFQENSFALYNLKDDHQEVNNLAEWETERVQSMYGLIRQRIVLSERNREHSIYSNSR